MRILFLSQYYPPEVAAPAARTHEHARHWVRCGHSVTVVCGLPNHPEGIVPPAYRGRLLFREHGENINVLRCWLYATPNRGVLRRSLGFFSFMVSAIFFGIFFSGKCDVVAATSPQLLCAAAGYLVAVCKRRPFVIEIRDLWPKQIIDLGVLKNPLAIRVLSGIEMFLYRRARGIVTTAEATSAEIVSRGIPADKVFTITNGIDETFFVPGDRQTPLRREQGWGERIVVLYIGTHGLSQGLTTILETADVLREYGDIQFVLAGMGAEREMLMQRAAEMNLENVSFLPRQAKENMPEFYQSADICLVPLRRCETFLYNIPSKMFEIMACARPIVLGVEGQAKRLLESAETGIAVEPENPSAYAEAILKLAGDPELRRRLGEAGRKHAVAHYGRNRKAEEYIEVFRRLFPHLS